MGKRWFNVMALTSIGDVHYYTPQRCTLVVGKHMDGKL
jgi:hypothetical protein